jgi:integrase/recombinase XerC
VNREQLVDIDLHWHDVRHEAACRWLAKGLDLRAIQLLLGHVDLKTTQRYLNVTDEELRRAMIEKLWRPRAPKSRPGECDHLHHYLGHQRRR